MTHHHRPPAKTSYAVLSIGAALVTIGLKFGAYLLTNSVGLFSDATESVVNLVAALMTLWMLAVAARPPDDIHVFGHSKAEYFSSGIEGMLIMLAAASIGWTTWGRLFDPQPLMQVNLGLALSLVATAINAGVAWILKGAGRRLRSISLQAEAEHLLTDVWTTGGVVLGIILVQLTGWLVLDPLLALLVTLHIFWIGVRLLRETGEGLLDSALPPEDQRVIATILDEYVKKGIAYHALRTRLAGPRRFVSLHVLVPGRWSVQRGHDLCEAIELKIANALPECNITTHLEPFEDPAAWDDQELDRPI